MATTRAAVRALPAGDRLARRAEQLLRLLGDGRTGLVLLLLVGAANAVAATLPGGPARLAAPWYAALLGALVASGVAAVVVRAPAAWREWRRPGAVHAGPGSLEAALPRLTAEDVAIRLAGAGYRVREDVGRGRWAVHGVRRGWARFAALGSHLAIVVIVLGAAIGAAFGSETTFSLLRGDQALLDAPRPGFSSAVRLEELDAEFGADGRPRRLDTRVTFLRDGSVVDERVLRVNEPGDFDGYAVHPWTYGPAVRLRVTDLAGATLLDAAVPLDDVRDGTPVGSIELPTAAVTLGLALTDAHANELGVSAVGGDGLVDMARIRPGQEARIGDVVVRLEGFDAWVTFLSRRDPGLAIVFAGGGLLTASLAIGFWLPRRRVTLRPTADGARLVLRGERLDQPAGELERLRVLLASP